MTKNAYVFSWDCKGIEAIVPISSYEDWDTANAFRVLEGKRARTNPMNETINMLIMRARFNPQRFYEIYAVDCDPSFTPSVWSQMWHDDPQMCADIIREKGVKIYGERVPEDSIRIR